MYVSHEALTAWSTWEETRHGCIYVLHHDPSGLKHNKILTNQAECCWLSWCRMKGELTCSCAQGSADRWWRVALSLQSLTYAKLAGPANHITNHLQPNTKQNTTTLQDNRNLNVLPAYVCVCVCVSAPVNRSFCSSWFWEAERKPDRNQHCVKGMEGAEAERSDTWWTALKHQTESPVKTTLHTKLDWW